MPEAQLDKVVLTTVYVIEYFSPIVYVSHDMDDDWQFFGSEENVEIDKARIVLLNEIIKMDPSVSDVLDMPKGPPLLLVFLRSFGCWPEFATSSVRNLNY